jgi:8-oxo-dGTP pyrophosphatase MutT (NUDIX family)
LGSISYVEWLREKVGNRKIFLPFATVVVRDHRGHILLQRRTDFDMWGLPGGVLELEEDLEACARRELKEETGLEVDKLRLVGVYTDPIYDVIYPNGDQVQQFTVCFEGVVCGGTMQHDGIETSEQYFFVPDRIKKRHIAVWYRDMIADALAGGTPSFKPPRSTAEIGDQIAAVRPFIGTDLYSGIGAAALVVDNNGRILMLQHRHETGWRLPAGFCDLGENVAHTVVREVREETGLRIQPERILAIHSTPRLNVTYRNGDQVRVVGVVFRAKLLGGSPSLDGREVLEMAWMTAEEALANYDFSRRWFFEKVLAHLNFGHIVC